MREITYAAKQVKTDTGGMLALTYSIIVDGGDDGPESYGVKIDELNGDTHAMIPGLTVSRERIEDLMDKLTRNTVTPTGLMDVLADWL